jgi:hypothetical protein
LAKPFKKHSQFPTYPIIEEESIDKPPEVPVDSCQRFFNPSGANITIQPSEALFPSKAPPPVIPERIHFLSYNSNLKTARYICSLESAMRHNPDHVIYLYTPEPAKMEKELTKWREITGKEDENLRILRLDYSIFKDTPMVLPRRSFNILGKVVRGWVVQEISLGETEFGKRF